VAVFGADHEFTKLIINHKGVDPEDAFSSIPYEKGFHLLYYLDTLVGREHFDKFIPHYFKTWARKSLDSFEFKKTFLDFFENYGNDEIKEKIAQIPWEERFYAPGLPPKPKFNTAYVDSCLALAEKWKQAVSIRDPCREHIQPDEKAKELSRTMNQVLKTWNLSLQTRFSSSCKLSRTSNRP
jgi:leukotriene-A4 hydrolase